MNYTLKPNTDVDRSRIDDWAQRRFMMVEHKDGNVVFEFGKDSLAAEFVYASLTRIANFDVL